MPAYPRSTRFVGFIGPEYLYDGQLRGRGWKTILREIDRVSMGLRRVYTNHTRADQNSLENLRFCSPPRAAGDYFIGVFRWNLMTRCCRINQELVSRCAEFAPNLRRPLPNLNGGWSRWGCGTRKKCVDGKGRDATMFVKLKVIHDAWKDKKLVKMNCRRNVRSVLKKLAAAISRLMLCCCRRFGVTCPRRYSMMSHSLCEEVGRLDAAQGMIICGRCRTPQNRGNALGRHQQFAQRKTSNTFDASEQNMNWSSSALKATGEFLRKSFALAVLKWRGHSLDDLRRMSKRRPFKTLASLEYRARGTSRCSYCRSQVKLGADGGRRIIPARAGQRDYFERILLCAAIRCNDFSGHGLGN